MNRKRSPGEMRQRWYRDGWQEACSDEELIKAIRYGSLETILCPDEEVEIKIAHWKGKTFIYEVNNCRVEEDRPKPVGQSWTHSHLETWTNIAIGFGVAYVSNMLILPHYGFEPSFRNFTEVALLYTAIAYVRGLAVRRLWNWIHIRGHRHESKRP